MNKDKFSNISQQLEQPRFINILQYYLNWRCDMEQQVDYLKPQPSPAVSQLSHALQDNSQFGKQLE